MKNSLLKFYIIFSLLFATLNMVAQHPGDTAGYGNIGLEGDDDPAPIDQSGAAVPIDNSLAFLALAGVSLAFLRFKAVEAKKIK